MKYFRADHQKTFSDKPTITEMRSITESTIPRELFFEDEPMITDIKRIPLSTITGKKCY